MSTFAEAFNGKKEKLAQKLEVSNDMLRSLEDKEIITSRHACVIKKIMVESDKVNQLLDVLGRRDDTLFDLFCDVFKKHGQQHVVAILTTKTPSKELCQIIEPR